MCGVIMIPELNTIAHQREGKRREGVKMVSGDHHDMVLDSICAHHSQHFKTMHQFNVIMCGHGNTK